MGNLNQKLTTKVGDIVWYLKIKHIETENVNDSRVYFDDIHQGKVISICGATGCTTCVDVVDISNNQTGAVQELFFLDFKDCLSAFNKVYGLYFGSNTSSWYDEYMNKVSDIIKYPYELQVSYGIDDMVETKWEGNNYTANIKRVIFDFVTQPYQSKKVSIQAVLNDYTVNGKQLAVSLSDNNSCEIKKVDIANL